jgi:phospholipase C
MPSPSTEPTAFTRRTLLSAAAGGAALLATRGLPARARPVAHPAGLRAPGTLPFPNKPAGTPSMPEIEHIVVLMMENHSFDNLLGMVPHQVPGRRSVDGLTVKGGSVVNSNPDGSGNLVTAQHAVAPCQLAGEPSQSWNASHQAYDNGRNDGFVTASAPVAMRFWDKRDIPFTYSLAQFFPIGERYFCSMLGQTFPNRCYFFAGTSLGEINDTGTVPVPPEGTIFDRLDAHHIDWGVYYQNEPSLVLVGAGGRSTVTASACRPSSSPRGPSRTTCRAWSRTTPRSPPSSSASGICPR